MDRKLTEKAQVERLIRRSADARFCLENEAKRIKQRFDVPAKIRGSLREHPTSWLIGSLASALVVSMLFSRRPKPSVKPARSGAKGKLLGLAVKAATPLAKVWVSKQLANWMQHAAKSNPSLSKSYLP